MANFDSHVDPLDLLLFLLSYVELCRCVCGMYFETHSYIAFEIKFICIYISVYIFSLTHTSHCLNLLSDVNIVLV